MSKSASARAFFNQLFYENIVLVQAVGLCPIIAGATTLVHGVTMSACMAAIVLPMALIRYAVGTRLLGWVRTVLYVVGAMLCLVGVSAVLNFAVSTELYAALYRFLPLIAINAVFFSKSNTEATTVLSLLGQTVGAILGFSVVTCLLSAARELLTGGTLWGVDMGWELRIPAAALPFAAFALLGLMAAILQWLRHKVAARRGEVLPEEVTFHG